MTADRSVRRVAMDPEFTLAAPEALSGSGYARTVAVDEQGDVYVTTANGVEVLPSPATLEGGGHGSSDTDR